jgi:hypothetical protein
MGNICASSKHGRSSQELHQRSQAARSTPGSPNDDFKVDEGIQLHKPEQSIQQSQQPQQQTQPQSRAASSSASSASVAAATTAAATTTQQPNLPSSASQNSPARASSQPLQPVRTTSRASLGGNWDIDFPALTLPQLKEKRAQFWETRVEGRSEMWQTIKMAIETDDAATSLVLLDSAGLTPLQAGGEFMFSYDARGFKYDVPMYCIHLPRNVILSGDGVAAGAFVAQSRLSAAELSADFLFKLRFSNGSEDMEVKTPGRVTIANIKQSVFKQKQIPIECQNVFFSGQKVHDTANIASLHLEKDDVISIFVKKL